MSLIKLRQMPCNDCGRCERCQPLRGVGEAPPQSTASKFATALVVLGGGWWLLTGYAKDTTPRSRKARA